MPIIKSAIKRAKQTVKRRERNILIKKDIKSVVKAFSAKPNAKNLSAVQSELDTAVKKGLIKKNTAARRKANLAKVAKNSGVKLASVVKKPTVKKPAKSTSEQKTTKKVVAKKATPKKPADKTAVKKSPVKKPTK